MDHLTESVELGLPLAELVDRRKTELASSPHPCHNCGKMKDEHYEGHLAGCPTGRSYYKPAMRRSTDAQGSTEGNAE